MNRLIFVVFHVISGIYGGACVSIALVDMRYMAQIEDPHEGFQIFAKLLKNMGMLMAPMLIALLFLSIYFSYRHWRKNSSPIHHLPLLITAVIVAVTLSVHIPMNVEIFSAQWDVVRFKECIESWSFWHDIRTGFALVLPWSIAQFSRRVEKKRL